MKGLELILLLLAAAAVLRMVAERLEIPYAALLVLGGLGLALVPGLPRAPLKPGVLFLVFVPPLVYWGARNFSLRDFKRDLGPIVRLAVILVLVSTAAVAVLVHRLDPAFTWPAAFALGAIVSPPDPVAVQAIMRSLRVSRPIMSILVGEGLFNDATALITYRAAVAAAVTGSFSLSTEAPRFLIAGLGGIAIGLAAGVVVRRAHQITRSVPEAEMIVSLLTPFIAYLPAEWVGASGILSVVATGMYVGRTGWSFSGPRTRVQVEVTWAVIGFLLESLVFIFVGLELPYVMRALTDYPLATLLRETAYVCACVIIVRLVFVLPSAYIGRTIDRWLGSSTPLPPWREVLFVGWAGVRGADSLVIALALPFTTASGAPFPARDQIVFITFGVIFVTLVLQAPTLAPLVRRLGLHGDATWANEEAHARLVAAEAGLEALDQSKYASSAHPEVVRYLRQHHRQRAQRAATREAQQLGGDADVDPHRHRVSPSSAEDATRNLTRAAEYRRIRAEMIAAERRALVRARNRGVIGDDVMRRVMRDLDLEAILLESGDAGGAPDDANLPTTESARGGA